MNQKLTNKLFNKYPDIFRDKDKSPKESLVCFGFEFDDGWYQITDNMLSQIDLVCKLTGIQIIATQMKEKFGTGRFYYYEDYSKCKKNIDHGKVASIIRAVISYWEYNLTAQTCEITGEWGILCHKGGWVKTLCKEQAKKLGYRGWEETKIVK